MAHTMNELVVGVSPTVIEETRAFWEGTLRSELLLQRCTACGSSQIPAGPCCAKCWSQSLEWVPASGRGTVFSFTVVRHAFHPSFMDKIPYVVADVHLEEGPIYTSGLINVDADAVRIGMPVRVRFAEPSEDAFHVPLRLPKFEPAEA